MSNKEKENIKTKQKETKLKGLINKDSCRYSNNNRIFRCCNIIKEV